MVIQFHSIYQVNSFQSLLDIRTNRHVLCINTSVVLEKGKKSDHIRPTILCHEERVSTLTNVRSCCIVVFGGLHEDNVMILSLSDRFKRCTIPFGLSQMTMIGLSAKNLDKTCQHATYCFSIV